MSEIYRVLRRWGSGTAGKVILVSVAVHLLAGTGAGFWIVARYFSPPPATFEVRKDLRLPAKEKEHRMNMAQFEALAPKPQLKEQLASIRQSKVSLPDVPKVPLDKMLPLDPSEIASDHVEGLIGSAGQGIGGTGAAGMGGTGKGMSFFGINDGGKSVVLMIDVSDSMFTRTGDAKGRKLVRKGKAQSFQRIRDEAMKLIDGLSVNAKFGIIRWSGGAYPWREMMVPATDKNKADATVHIQNDVDMKTARPRGGRPGGTRHDYALEEAFRLQPEVIYMLTDGNATTTEGGGMKAIDPGIIWGVAEIGQKKMAKPARLHVIYYLTGQEKEDERKMLKTLAQRNGGKFLTVKAN